MTGNKMNYIGLFAAFVVIASTLMGCSDEPSNWPKKSFDAARWTASNEKDRFVFVRDLIDRRALIGLQKPEVFTMLGKPSYEDEKGEYITYIVKADSGRLSILDLRFDKFRTPAVVEKAFVRSD
jgi:hypothetical protein